MRCQYRQTIVNDPLNPEKSIRENIMLLQIGKDVSRYSDIKKIMGDSLMLALEKQGADNNTIIRKLLPLDRGRSSEVILIVRRHQLPPLAAGVKPHRHQPLQPG